MKKMLALMLAVMLALVPVLGMADLAWPTDNEALRFDFTVTADEEGCKALLGEENGAMVADILNSMSEVLWVTTDGLCQQETMGEITMTSAMRVLGDVVYLKTDLLKDTFKLTNNQSASTSVGGVDMEAMMQEMANVKWSTRNTASVVTKLMRRISSTTSGNNTVVTIKVTPALLSELVEALAKDALASKGLDEVMLKYASITDFPAYVEQYRSQAADFVALLKSDLVLVVSVNNRTGAAELSLTAAIEVDGAVQDLAVNLTYDNTSVVLTCTLTNNATGEYVAVNFSTDMSSMLNLSVTQLKLEDGQLINSTLVSFSMLRNRLALTVQDAQIFDVTVNARSIEGMVANMPLNVNWQKSGSTFVVNMTLDQAFVVLNGKVENGLMSGDATVSYQGNTLCTVAVTETKAAPDWTWDELMDIANARELSELLTNQDELDALLDELTAAADPPAADWEGWIDLPQEPDMDYNGFYAHVEELGLQIPLTWEETFAEGEGWIELENGLVIIAGPWEEDQYAWSVHDDIHSIELVWDMEYGVLFEVHYQAEYEDGFLGLCFDPFTASLVSVYTGSEGVDEYLDVSDYLDLYPYPDWLPVNESDDMDDSMSDMDEDWE